MSTLTTFLFITNGILSLVIFLQAGTIKRLFKTLRDYKEVMQLRNVLHEIRKKRDRQKYTGDEKFRGYNDIY